MDQLKNVRTKINKPSDTMLSLVGLTVTVLMMSAATRTSSPRRMARPNPVR